MWNRRNRPLNDLTFQILDLLPDDHVLEIGIGGGALSREIQSQVVEGCVTSVDHSFEVISFNRKFSPNSLIQADGLCLPFRSGIFSKICTVNTIFYFRDLRMACEEMFRVLKSDGMAVVCFTDRADLEQKKFTKHGLQLYHKDDVMTLLAEVGFQEIHSISGSDRHRTFHCVTGVKNCI